MRSIILLLIFLLLNLWNVCAQTQITGSVSDEKGEWIPGANISIAGTYDGTSTSY